MKHKLTRLTSLLLAFIMTFSMLLVPVEAAEFSDVPEGCWYAGAVDYVYEKGWMVGVGDSTFAPNLEVTRGMFVTVLAKYAQADLSAVEPAFTDTPAGAWYTGPCAWAAEKGITAGAGDGLFLPNRSITRQDLVTILYRFIEKMGYSIPTGAAVSFNDIDQASAYAVDAVNFCASAGLVAGVGDGGFHPLDTATRSQLAVILMKLDSLVNGGVQPTDPNPAQSFDGRVDESLSVSVTAPAGALPENSSMTVMPVTDEARLTSIADQIGSQVYAAANITFLNNGVEIEPEKAVEVQFTMDGLEELQHPFVVHVRDDGQIEYLNAEVVSVNRAGTQKALRFYAKDFSVYAVGNDPSQQIKLLTVRFYESNGTTIINAQAIRLDQLDKYVELNKDYLFDPGVPDINRTQSFEGWVKMETGFSGYTEEDRGWDVSEINQSIKDQRATLKNSAANVEWNFCAKVFNVRYVVYHDQAGSILMTQNYHVKEGQLVSVPINWPYVGFKGGQNFVGWIEESGIEREDPDDENSALMLGDYPRYADNVGQVYENGKSYEMSETIQLYPYLNTGHTIVYDTLKDQDLDSTSTTFVPPAFFAEGEHTYEPEQPERIGYEFVGWYEHPEQTQAYDDNGNALYINNETHELTTDATTNGKPNDPRKIVLDSNWGTEYVFGSTLNESTKLYARWQPKATTYHVSVWQQLANDVIDDNNLNNKYAYYEPTTVDIILPATTGDKVSLGEAYKLLGNQNNDINNYGEMGYYFVFNQARTNQENGGNGEVVVKGDGSTVLNAYYDRKLITISFYTNSNMNTLWNGGSVYQEVGAGETGHYYYYTAPYATGYYLCGTGPDTTNHPTPNDTRSLSGYYWGYASISGTSASGYTALNGNTPANPNNNVTAYGTSATGYVLTSNEGYYYERYDTSSSSFYHSYQYYPIYYSYTAPYTSGYYEVGKGPTPTAEGTHNLITFPNPMVGLYQGPLNNWPTEPEAGKKWQYVDAEDGKTYGITVRDCFDIPDNLHTTEWKIYALTDSATSFKTIHWMIENVDDSNFTEKTRSSLGNNTNQYYDNNKFLGFNAYGHNLTTNSTTSGFVDYTKGAGVSYDNAGNNSYIYFTRRKNNFVYMSNGEEINTVSNVKYQAKLDSFGSFEPSEDDTPDGFYFDGWYADPGCTEKYVFTGNTMPEHEVAIYAKWVQIRFRVIFEPRGADAASIQPSEIVIPNDQATTFRIDYGETVQGANFDMAAYANHTLLGWYLDTDPTNDTVYDTAFNFGMPMTTHGGMADMTYADAYASQRTGVDPWKNNKPYNDSDGENDDVVGKIIVYARWRENPDGVVGINVRYITTDAEGHTGKFSDGDTEWEDPNTYADEARAFAQPASKPDDPTLQFLYWEILNADNQVVGKAYPGKLWDVHIEDAKVTDLTVQPVYVTAPDAEPYQPVNATEVRPEPVVKDEEPTREPTRAAHNYVAVTQPSPGKKYLLAFTDNNSGLAGIMSYEYYDTSSSINPKAVLASVSNGIISGDYDDYLFGAEYYNGYYWLGNLNQVQYMSVSSAGNLYYGYNSNYDSYSDWTYNTSTKKLYNRGYGSSIGLYGSTGNYYYQMGSSYSAITFYEREESEVTGKNFYRVTELQIGDQIIIAHDDLAMSNELVENNRRLKPTNVKHNMTGNESITVPIDAINSVSWEVVSGNATNGFVLKNLADNRYLSMDSSEYLTTTTSASSAMKWKLNGTDLVGVTASTYPYVKFSNEFVNFDTAKNGNRDIRIYAATRNHTVTFVDGCPGAENAVIAAVEVEDGKSATAPTAPTHSGYVFDHWDRSFTNVTEDITVTAVYVSIADRTYTVTFRFMDSEGNWITREQTVQHGHAAVNPRLDPEYSFPAPPAGYTFNSWDKRFDSITSNLTVNGVYKLIPTKKYTITLRAKYGLASKDATTHIFWYANNGTADHNGAGVRQENTGIQINEAIYIPTPTTFQYVTTRATETGLEYVGHEFVGWARLENETGSNESAHPELNENSPELYLKWVKDANGNGHYEVKDPENGFNDWTGVNKVAADEMRPYHDMYAVWKSHVFYVFHSNSGKLQAFDIPMTAGTGEQASQLQPGTFDMTAIVQDGFLYGGYYKTYGGVDMEKVEAAARTIGSSGWDAGTMASEDWTELAELNKEKISGANFQAYDGASLVSESGKRFWTKADAYNSADGKRPEGMSAEDVNGHTMKPVADAIYYLKEVPAEKYLHSHYVWIYTFDAHNPTHPIQKVDDLYLISVVDDNNYDSTGFRINGTYQKRTTITSNFTVVRPGNDELHIDPAMDTYSAGDFGAVRGYLSIWQKGAATGTFTMLPTWITLDGVTVGNSPLSVTVEENNVTHASVTIPAEKKMLYVNIERHKAYWELEDAETYGYFYNNDTGAVGGFVNFKKIDDSWYYEAEIPGNMTHVILIRMKKDKCGWGADNLYSRSTKIPLSDTFNCINSFDKTDDPNYEWWEDSSLSWITFIPKTEEQQ